MIDTLKNIKSKPVDEPHLYNLYMPHGLYVLAKKKAMREYKSLAEVVREFLESWTEE